MWLVTRDTWDHIKHSNLVDKQTRKKIIHFNGLVGWYNNNPIHIGFAPKFGASWVELVCSACGGNGEIGGLTPTGYESEPCPFCSKPVLSGKGSD